eukprot:COSAG01_NODE_937_length_12628_cov_12.665257_6_plen_123_part_00
MGQDGGKGRTKKLTGSGERCARAVLVRDCRGCRRRSVAGPPFSGCIMPLRLGGVVRIGLGTTACSSWAERSTSVGALSWRPLSSVSHSPTMLPPPLTAGEVGAWAGSRSDSDTRMWPSSSME